MRRTLRLAALLLAAGLIAGCDPKPSTPLAPDAPAPDTSGLSKEDVLRMKQQGESGR